MDEQFVKYLRLKIVEHYQRADASGSRWDAKVWDEGFMAGVTLFGQALAEYQKLREPKNETNAAGPGEGVAVRGAGDESGLAGPPAGGGDGAGQPDVPAAGNAT